MPDEQAVSTQAAPAAPAQQAVGGQAKTSKLNIPNETREQFPDLIPLIEQSPSMNDEERQYWVDVLPIMTEDQIKNLNDILGTEKKQISEANQQYSNSVEGIKKKAAMDFNESAYKAKKQAIRQAEKTAEIQEKTEEEATLKEIEEMRV